ncbi:MAG TPA: bifunctional [glutamate--ammonia ligase]-adenylyl-L-tyrosine phosphorylase/[glutamate--ammonia-ligase] adenylyltransferase [Gammaproteobacteria bacterium]|nr:bifunctional [glutamate--ammonia ligase]-adenylyl-L-tyrosine phosphorylase/[glutamate--ammonia-ligase] adenylyltransferase [Gammaproteobacteria bacterium]
MEDTRSLLHRSLKGFPRPLVDEVEHAWTRYVEAAREAGIAPPAAPGLLHSLFRVWSFSEFVAGSCATHPALLADLLKSGDLLRDYGPQTHARLAASLLDAGDDAAMARALRRLRRREMVRIAWRDLAGWADLEETLRDLSLLAEALLNTTLEWLYPRLCRSLGTPHDARGHRPQPLVVLGMGKLGARELNFSSDIDLIFAYPEEGETRGRRPRISNQAFFNRLGQALITLLDEPTEEGRVYRVDMRLRPYGSSGPLAMSFAAMEDYYQSQGREWERYAMIKARPVAGDEEAGRRLMALLRPFVYRRYLDYNALASLRDMKAMIDREVARRSLQDNIKLGPGGIREIEFIGQAFQLIRGGREPALRARGILEVLNRLVEAGHLPPHAARRLQEAYVFLRRTENRLQAHGDRQTHVLPQETTDRQRLALAMGYGGWKAFKDCLDHHRRQVQEQFSAVFSAPQGEGHAEEEGTQDGAFARIWRQDMEQAAILETLARRGFDDPDEALRRIRLLRDGHVRRALSEEGRRRLDRLMPLLLSAVAARPRPDETLPRVLDLIEAIAQRTTYLALLEENPMALSQLVRLCGASPWVARTLQAHPVLLDELMDPRNLYAPVDPQALETELASRLAAVDPGDEEQQMEILRHFKQAHVLRVAAADIMETLPLMEVSDHLTAIAETCLREVLRLALEQLGRRRRLRNRDPRSAGFAIVAYGKLGGIELGYGSDLDLVFLHRGGSARQPFYARLGQRIIHMLNTHTPGGVLYEVDMRLRPSGASGLLVSSLAAYARYQAREAWTWEHQALVRARFICGDSAVGRGFEAVRKKVLCLPRDPARLAREVVEMRERMRTELARGRGGLFDIKQDRGGLTDIEFIVQYAVLRWAGDHPELTRWTDNVRLLADLARLGLLEKAEARALDTAYRDYRRAIHHLALQERPALVEATPFRTHRRRVTAVWERLLGGPLEGP